MKGIQRSFREKLPNNLMVAVLLGFGTWNFISTIVQWWNQGPSDYWHGQLIRAAITYVIILILAEAVARLAK